MGLDISAWSKVEKAAPCPTCGHVADAEECEADEVRYSIYETDFVGRAAPFEDGDVVIVSGEHDHARYGYSGWNIFRSLICEAANGVPADSEHPQIWERAERGDVVLWDLINFTDCDGYLGPIACERIHRELRETREKFVALAERRPIAYFGTTLVERYDALIALFAVAAHGGMVRFG